MPVKIVSHSLPPASHDQLLRTGVAADGGGGLGSQVPSRMTSTRTRTGTGLWTRPRTGPVRRTVSTGRSIQSSARARTTCSRSRARRALTRQSSGASLRVRAVHRSRVRMDALGHGPRLRRESRPRQRNGHQLHHQGTGAARSVAYRRGRKSAASTAAPARDLQGVEGDVSKACPHGRTGYRRLAVGAFGPARRKRQVDTGDLVDTGEIVVSSGPPAIISPEAAMGCVRCGDWMRMRADDTRGLETDAVPAVLPREPLLVQRRTKTASITSSAGTGRRQGVLRERRRACGASSGEYLEANALARGNQEFPSWGTLAANLQTESATRRHIPGRWFTLPDGRGRVLARAEGVGVNPSFVWRPCLESLSPSMPFRVITIGDRLSVTCGSTERHSSTFTTPGPACNPVTW